MQLLPRQYPLSPAWRWTSFAVWASKVVPGTKSVAGLLYLPGVNDPYELGG